MIVPANRLTENVSAVVCTWNTAETIDDCLESLKKKSFRKEEDYMPTNPPDDAFIYQVGQILLKKEGTPRVGTIQEITPSAEEHLTEYEIALYTPKGQYIQTALYQTCSCTQKLIECFPLLYNSLNLVITTKTSNPEALAIRRLCSMILS